MSTPTNPPFRQLFGNEHAAADDLLEECYVPPPNSALGSPILVGRWGTGKTGLLLHRNSALSSALREIDESIDRIWYIDETAVQLQTLKRIEDLCASDVHMIKRILEDAWKSEILRSVGTTLYHLHGIYGAPDGPHWSRIRRLQSTTADLTIWDMIPNFFGSTFSKDKKDSFQELITQIQDVSSRQRFQDVQACLRDIRDHPVQPVVAIEPIETPDSEIENSTDLAQMLVICLLNVFYKHFQPSYRQLVRVEVSIPWHRFIRDQVGEPQKITPFIGRFKWTPTSLRHFINKRIEWEFKRVRRAFTAKGNLDAWSALFESTVRNTLTHTREDTFQYVLRHSQYRVRDILRITRTAVEFEAVKREEANSDNVLIGRGGLKVSEKSLRAAVRRACGDTAIERILEATRRFQHLHAHIEALRGKSIPFDFKELKSRWQNGNDEILTDDSIFKVLDELWRSGIVGLQMKAMSSAAVAQLKASIGSGCLVHQRTDGSTGVFYVFDHLSDRKPYDLLMTYDHSTGRGEHADIETKIVIHPMMFEYLDVRPTERYPIGI